MTETQHTVSSVGIELLKDTQFYVEFEECINLGMSVHAFNCKIQNAKVLLNKELLIM